MTFPIPISGYETASPTHVAVASGNWNQSATWNVGTVPDATSHVHIPMMLTVDHTDAQTCRTLAVEGTLNTSAEITLDFCATSMMSTVNGSPGANWIVADIDSDRSDNYAQLAPGIMPMGTWIWQGGRKARRGRLSGGHTAGVTRLTMRAIPTGWAIGDRIVVAGTRFNSAGNIDTDARFQDEELTITAIDGDEIEFTNANGGGNALLYDHVPPTYANPGNVDFAIPVGNLSCDMRIRSAVTAPIASRGHVMFMSHRVRLLGVAFEDLGRTQKMIPLNTDEPVKPVNGVVQTMPANDETGAPNANRSNIAGRYPLHFHEVLMDANGEGVDDGRTAQVDYCVVNGSPGWGMTLHSSRVSVRGSFVYDTRGAGIQGEEGNEQISLIDNLVMKIGGRFSETGGGVISTDKTADMVLNRLHTNQIHPIDLGWLGDGIWIDGGGSTVDIRGNWVASCEHAAVIIYGDNDNEKQRWIPAAHMVTTHRAPPRADGTYDCSKHPIVISNTCSLNCHYGEFWAGPMRDDSKFDSAEGHQDAPLQSQQQCLSLNSQHWALRAPGLFHVYSQCHSMRGGFLAHEQIVQRTDRDNNAYRRTGGTLQKAAHDRTFEGVTFFGMFVAMSVGKSGSQAANVQDPFDQFVYRGCACIECDHIFFSAFSRTGFSPNFGEHNIIQSPPFSPYAQVQGDLTVIPAPTPSVTVVATYQRVGPNMYWLDASGSSCSSYTQTAQIVGKEVIDNDIPAVRWEKGGQVIAYGRDAVVNLKDPSGITCRCFDWNGGQATGAPTEIAAAPLNAVLDPTFALPLRTDDSHSTETENVSPGRYSPFDFRKVVGTHVVRWRTTAVSNTPDFNINANRLIVSEQRNQQIAETVHYNRRAHRGICPLSFDLLYDGAGNFLRVEVIGCRTEHRYGLHNQMRLNSVGRPGGMYAGEYFHQETLLLADLSTTSGTQAQSYNIDFRNGFDTIYLRFQGEQVPVGAAEFSNVNLLTELAA